MKLLIVGVILGYAVLSVEGQAIVPNSALCTFAGLEKTSSTALKASYKKVPLLLLQFSSTEDGFQLTQNLSKDKNVDAMIKRAKKWFNTNKKNLKKPVSDEPCSPVD